LSGRILAPPATVIAANKNKSKKPGGRYEHRKQNSSDRGHQPWHGEGTRQLSGILFVEANMCPFCLASMGLVVAGAVSTGGLAALAVKVSRKTNAAEEIVPNLNNNLNNEEK
jgi:hypothetical protein